MPSYLHKRVSGIATKNNKLDSQRDARLRGHDGVLLRVFTVLRPLMRVFLCDLTDGVRRFLFMYVLKRLFLSDLKMTGVFTGYVVHAQIGEKIGAVKVRIIGRFAADFTAQTHIAFEQSR